VTGTFPYLSTFPEQRYSVTGTFLKAGDYWDGNWLISPIELVVGGFRGDVAAGLRMDELAGFREALESLHASLQGEAVLDSMEGWIQLRVVIDRRGSLQVSGKALDQPGSVNTLTFTIDGLDQTYLPAVISALAAAETRFPIRGQPGP
jgi:hypothetical protein